MVICRPGARGTDPEGEFSDPNLVPITLETPEMINTDASPWQRTSAEDQCTDAMLFRSRLTAEDLQAAGFGGVVPATWTRSTNPLFIVSAEATYT